MYTVLLAQGSYVLGQECGPLHILQAGFVRAESGSSPWRNL